MENLEIKLLEKDRDLRIEYLNIEKAIQQNMMKIELQMNKNAVKDYAWF